MVYVLIFIGFYLATIIATVVATITKSDNIPIGSAIAKDLKNKNFLRIVKRYFVYTWISVTLVIILVPLLWMVSVAFTEGKGADLHGVPIVPDVFKWTTSNFKRLFEVKTNKNDFLPDYWQAFLTTLMVAIVNTVAVVTVSALTGVALSRFKFQAKKATLLTMMGLQLFPTFLAMLAIFFLFRTLGILDKPLALVLIYVAGAVPYNTFIIRGYLRNIPKSLDEAATIDGANNIQLLRYILVPLMVPILGFIAVNAFMTPWMDYILPAQLLQKNTTIAVYLFPYSNPLTTDAVKPYDPRLYFAGALFLTIPIMSIQIYMQKYVIKGLMAGADKG